MIKSFTKISFFTKILLVLISITIFSCEKDEKDEMEEEPKYYNGINIKNLKIASLDEFNFSYTYDAVDGNGKIVEENDIEYTGVAIMRSGSFPFEGSGFTISPFFNKVTAYNPGDIIMICGQKITLRVEFKLKETKQLVAANQIELEVPECDFKIRDIIKDSGDIYMDCGNNYPTGAYRFELENVTYKKFAGTDPYFTRFVTNHEFIFEHEEYFEGASTNDFTKDPVYTNQFNSGIFNLSNPRFFKVNCNNTIDFNYRLRINVKSKKTGKLYDTHDFIHAVKH